MQVTGSNSAWPRVNFWKLNLFHINSVSLFLNEHFLEHDIFSNRQCPLLAPLKKTRITTTTHIWKMLFRIHSTFKRSVKFDPNHNLWGRLPPDCSHLANKESLKVTTCPLPTANNAGAPPWNPNSLTPNSRFTLSLQALRDTVPTVKFNLLSNGSKQKSVFWECPLVLVLRKCFPLS